MTSKPTIHLHKDDLPAGLKLGKSVAIDTETMGLKPPTATAFVWCSYLRAMARRIWCRFAQNPKPAPNLARLLTDEKIETIYHYARFDVAVLSLNIAPVQGAIYCRK